MYLLFDIGGTNLRLAVSDDGKTIGQHKLIPTPPDIENGLQSLKQIGDKLAGDKKIQGLSGGIAVVFDKDKNISIKSTHLQGWVNHNIKENLEKMFGVSVKLENDTAVYGLGEAVFGAGKGSPIVCVLTIGTGVGGVRIVNGKIDEKAFGFEPGHQIIEIDGKDCQCGGKGHLETYVAGSYIGRDADWDQVAKYLAVGLNNTIVHWSPDVVVLGGAVMKSVSLEKVKAYLEKDLTIFPKLPEIVSAKLGDKGGLYGALAMLL